ncbi:neuromedin-U receptor 1 [Megalops cyprinoides]|uniref:neuromedin-U receptor 1 n=1 Tax=Megalops cyprinoides TaxID=118141 RepID=UPI001863FA46|nr:neuromedin-U receptor 1 [Megalops cyprinoides]
MEYYNLRAFLQNCSGVGDALCNLTGNVSGAGQHLTIDDILLNVLGPKRSSFFLPVSIIYLLIFITGVTGNLLTCTVIAKHRKMRTPTNLYLFSLAVSDLLVLLFGMPLEIYDLWQNYPFPFGEGGCYFKTFLFETVCFASVLNVMALSVERYFAVVHPLKTRYAVTNKHARRVIGIVWAVSLACAVPNTSLHGIYYLYLPERVAESATCSLLKPRWIYNLVIQVTTVLFYLVPMTVISALYLVICCRLDRERRLPHGTLGRNWSSGSSWKIHVESGRRRQVTKMLSVVVVVFAICWAPFHVDRLLWSFVTQWTDLMHRVFQYVHILSGVLFYLSSAVNPIIYNLLSTRFRECFHELVCLRSEALASRGSSPPPPKLAKGPSALGASAGDRDPGKVPAFTISAGSWEGEDETTYA